MLVEQNPMHCRLYSDLLEANGFDVYVAKSVMDALVKIREKAQDLILINTEIVEEKFIQKFIHNVRNEEISKNTPIIGISIYGETKKKNIAEIVDSFLTKPFSLDRLMESIDGCIEGPNDTESSNYQ
ncbi:MAG: response regulator [Alphaproteobacteria bacterium]|nr:response regulator [Alphaproteobacteria bacterium]